MTAMPIPPFNTRHLARDLCLIIVLGAARSAILYPFKVLDSALGVIERALNS